MGATHTTDREKQLFQHLVSTGMSVRHVSRLTGRSHCCITNNVDPDVMTKENQTSIWTDEDMYKIFDLHSAGKRVVDISREMNRPNQTVSSITRRVNAKHQKAYAKWLELQGQAEAPVVSVVHPALAAIRAARKVEKQEEESPALVMEVQTVESKPCDCDCNFTDSKICQVMSSSIDHHRKMVAEYKETITKQNTTIAELREINGILKGYVKHLQILNEQ